MTAASNPHATGPAGETTEQSRSRTFRADILAQPANLERAAATFLAALGRAELRRFQADPVVFTGMGASLLAGVPAAQTLRAGGRLALAMPATEVVDPGGERVGAAFVAVSQSGRSAETVAALRAVDRPRLALANIMTSPLADVADLILPIGSIPDAGISILTYTATLLAGAALAAVLLTGEFHANAGPLAEAVAALLEPADAVAERVSSRLQDVRAVDVIGQGFSAASAGYGALLIREAARIPASGFDTHQYLHGPLEVAEAGMGAVLLGAEREVGLAGHLASAGVAVLLIPDTDVRVPDGVEVIRLPDVPAPLRPILEAIPLQLLADHLARARGLAPGVFRHHQDDTKVKP
jgi:glutamine---fructose-6-phosphate transaminase (isomerizing)